MSTRLDQFINENREDFDDEMPSPKVWDNIQDKVFHEKKIEAPVVKINFMKWSAAAAAVVLVALGAWFLMRANNNNNVKPANSGEVATVKPTVPEKR